MPTIEATYRVTTPMFLGGAEPQQAELRLPSLKGALRFWWRASVWPSIAARGGSVKDLHRLEAELFGSSDERVGQSKVSLRLRMDSDMPAAHRVGTQLKDGNSVVGQGVRYLGYGVMEAFASTKKNTPAGQLTRECLSQPFSFRVGLVVRGALDETQREQILLALKFLGLLGSLGSKARKGYGSLTLSRLIVAGKEVWSPPSSVEELRTALNALFKQALHGRASRNGAAATGGHPPFTALSNHTKVLIVPPRETSTSPLRLLDYLGREMIRYRSWGRNGRILGKENEQSEKQFEGDHDLMKKPVAARSSHPERIAFGLPHNYGREENKKVTPADQDLKRRASPLWLHIHQSSDGAPAIALLCFMPATFLPENRSDISVGGKRVPLNTDNLWNPVLSLLDRFSRGRTEEPFGKIVEVSHV
ncbi:MAG: type III-B CRISPR module RAMP protein Cmr1 [Acidobacteriota bacterium]